MITLTTDFGYQDHYAGVMKGVILSIEPNARVVDITHGIRRHDIRHAAYVLRSIIDYFPRAIHVFVVDPGVGTNRLGIVAELDRGYYVGPDNGILTHVQHRVKKVWKIEMDAKSNTFHGRDVFAPTAARLLRGDLSYLVPVEDFETFSVTVPEKKNGTIQGEVLHIDRFGNVITNVPESMVRGLTMVTVNGTKINMVKAYGELEKGALLSLINSEKLFELAVNQGSAAEKLKIRPGDRIIIEI